MTSSITPEPAAAEELRRLATLRAYRVLDTAPEEALDDLTALAAQICDAPISLISLVDEHRQWFKSRVGVDATETPRDISFCAHALQQSDLLIVPDATLDPRFAKSPLVTGEPGIRFYAGAPLITPEGVVLGTICVIDRLPRILPPAQERALVILARQVMTHLELHRQFREREEATRMRIAIFEAEPDCMKLLSATGRVQLMNNAGLRIIEADSIEQIAGESVVPLLREEYQPAFIALIDRVFAGETATMEYQLIGLKGTIRWLDLHASPLRDEDGKVVSLVGISRDVSERKRSEARFRWLVDSNAQGVMLWNTRGEVTEANQAFLDLIGYSREDLEAGLVNWTKLTPPEWAKFDQRALKEMTETGVCTPWEKEYIRKDGSRVPLLIGAAVFADRPEDGVCFTVDLTERKKLERQVIQAQRMESVSTLAGGIAHDLNNALTPIVTSIEVLQTHFQNPASQELLETIRGSALRGVAMVRQILSFARRIEAVQEKIDVPQLLRGIERFVHDTFPQTVRVRAIVPAELWPIAGDVDQLRQMLLNLCLNARDAMPNGGTITLTAQNITLDAHDAGLVPEACEGQYVVLRVADTSPGMTPEVLDRIFEPFFDAQATGSGTGLVLSTALGIAKNHGGFIRAHSQPGEGSSFEVFLPANAETSPESEEASFAELRRGNGELILVVDDEAAIREVTQQTLETFGYRAVLADGGTEAFAAFATQSGEIACAIVDMKMPLFDGPTTIRVLRQMNPALPVIVISGQHVDLKTVNLDVDDFLLKPYTAPRLLEALHLVLAAARKD